MYKNLNKTLNDYSDDFILEIIDQEAANSYLKTAKELGLSDEQIQGIWEWIILGAANFVEEMNGAANQYGVDAEKSLRDSYGNDFEPKLQGARNLIQQYGDEEFADFLKKSGMGNRREIINFLMKLADGAGEDKGLAGEKSAVVPTKEKIKAEIARLMAVPAYMQAQHPEHNSTVQQVYGLRKRLFGEA